MNCIYGKNYGLKKLKKQGSQNALFFSMRLIHSFEKSFFAFDFENRSAITLLRSFEKSCLSRKLFVTHLSAGNCVKVKTRSKVWRFFKNSFGRLQNGCYIGQSNARLRLDKSREPLLNCLDRA